MMKTDKELKEQRAEYVLRKAREYGEHTLAQAGEFQSVDVTYHRDTRSYIVVQWFTAKVLIVGPKREVKDFLVDKCLEVVRV